MAVEGHQRGCKGAGLPQHVMRCPTGLTLEQLCATRCLCQQANCDQQTDGLGHFFYQSGHPVGVVQGADDAHVPGGVRQGRVGQEGQDARHSLAAPSGAPGRLGNPRQQLHVPLRLLCGHELAPHLL